MTAPSEHHLIAGVTAPKVSITRRRVAALMAVSLVVSAGTTILYVRLAPDPSAASFSWPRFYLAWLLGFAGRTAYLTWFVSGCLWLIREAGAWPSSRDPRAWRAWVLSLLFSAGLVCLGFLILGIRVAAELH